MAKGFDLHQYLLNNLPKQLEVPDGYIRLSGPLERDNIVYVLSSGLKVALITAKAVKILKLGIMMQVN